jgi:hypothetical protein
MGTPEMDLLLKIRIEAGIKPASDVDILMGEMRTYLGSVRPDSVQDGWVATHIDGTEYHADTVRFALLKLMWGSREETSHVQ